MAEARKSGGRVRSGKSVSMDLPFIIGVTGGTCSGKSSVCKQIVDQLGNAAEHRVYTLPTDLFYKTGQLENFDHPSAFDDQLLLKTLKDLKEGKSVSLLEYNHKNHERGPNKIEIPPADVIIVEGILVLYDSDIRDMLDMKVFVDLDSDTRLSKRVFRDLEMGRELNVILEQYISQIKPAFEDFILPTKKYADVIIPRGSENTVAIGLIVQHIKHLLSLPDMPSPPQAPQESESPKRPTPH